MKAVFLLLFCFGMLPVFSHTHLLSVSTLTAHEPHLKEFLDYYKNGNLKCKTIVIYNGGGSEEKTITEAYRKDGSRRYRSVMNSSDLLQYTRYNKQGKMKFERSYYYSGPFLQSVETRRADGKVRTWTEPPPETDYGSYNQPK